MKIICAVLLAVIFSFELCAQTNLYQSHLNLKSLNLKTFSDKNYASVFNTGIEYGKLLNLTVDNADYFYAYWIYFDFNVWNKILYIRLDLGGVSDRSFRGGAGIISLGLNSRFFGYGRHNFYFYAGLKGAVSGYPAALLVLNPKYVFSLSRLIGVSAGIRFMNQIGYSQRFLIYSAGVQFSFL